VRPAYELNVSPIVRPLGPTAEAFGSLLTVNAPNVIVESVKWAEEGTALIVRLYEAAKSGTAATVRFHVPVQSVAKTDLLEENGKGLRLRRGAASLRLRPFEIATLRCEL